MNKLRIFLYSFGEFSHGSYAAFINAVLPLYLSLYTKNTALIGLMVTVSSFERAIAPMIIGPVTDRLSTRLGRRKLFIMSGTILVILSLLLLQSAVGLGMIIALLLIAGLGNGITIAPYFAMLTKQAKQTTVGTVTALISVFGLLGQITLTLLAFMLWKNSIPASAFVILAGLFVIPLSVVLLTSSDDTKPVKQEKKKRWLLTFFTDKTRNRYMLSQLCIWAGINSILPFFTLFITRFLGRPQSDAILLYFTVILASGVFAYPFALLGKKIGEIFAYRIGLVAFVITAVIGIFAKQLPFPLMFFLAFLAGFGFASTAVFSFALLTRLVSEHQMGTASGANSLIVSFFAPVAAVASGYLITRFNYPVMFGILLAASILCLLLLQNKGFTKKE